MTDFETVEKPRRATLTPKQEQFCLAYARLNDGAKAAREAGYAARSARVTACELLTKENIKERVQELKAQRQVETEARHEVVQERLSCAAEQAITALEKVLTDDTASASAKVAASIAILDRAGHFPKATGAAGQLVVIGAQPEPRWEDGPVGDACEH
ncbi:MAG: terminase small subunit [Gammaproteobacteria bacterium]|nr:terminase small subunit [Gammaproteobacteria bacterium]